MNSPSSPRIQVIIDPTSASVRVLAELRGVSPVGLSELRSQISTGAPVLDLEMFTNDWYDNAAARLLNLLSNWKDHGVDYTLLEINDGINGVASTPSQITVDELRAIVSSGQEERARIEELDDLRCRG